MQTRGAVRADRDCRNRLGRKNPRARGVCLHEGSVLRQTSSGPPLPLAVLRLMNHPESRSRLKPGVKLRVSNFLFKTIFHSPARAADTFCVVKKYPKTHRAVDWLRYFHRLTPLRRKTHPVASRDSNSCAARSGVSPWQVLFATQMLGCEVLANVRFRAYVKRLQTSRRN